MKKGKRFNSIRMKLFLTLSMAVIIIIVILILLNNMVLEAFYLYSKQNSLKDAYEKINSYYNNPNDNVDAENELNKIAINNNFDILIKTDEDLSIFTSNRNFYLTVGEIDMITSKSKVNKKDMLYTQENMNIRKMKDSRNGLTYVLLSAQLDNGYLLYIRIPIASIQESVKISNNFLYLIGGFTILIAAVIISFISKRFTEPILELNDIAQKMSNLDFSKKYKLSDTEDEINMLGKSINKMSDKLEGTIKQLRNSNIELERDIEEKSKIDEMRKQFISDVSHELKTPISLIQGYSEGLIENVNADEESKKFYADVILDESNKMDKLVKQLLELMKLEYGKRNFNNTKFNINELIKEVIRKYSVMLEENNILIKFEENRPTYVIADDFYIEQVITNYITNAIKNIAEIEKEKYIEIKVEEKDKIVKISVFNTGDNIEEENLRRIWNRFYKVDTSRNRDAGGSGIGLSLVKAIMNNYHKEYGVENKYNGVEFYFELDKEIV